MQTRPTPARVREALFSALEPLAGTRVLDLYAGSGALGIEAFYADPSDPEYIATCQRRGLSEHIILILLVIGVLAFSIDRFLLRLQHGIFPYRTDAE